MTRSHTDEVAHKELDGRSGMAIDKVPADVCERSEWRSDQHQQTHEKRHRG
jgi:hypothetical protein